VKIADGRAGASYVDRVRPLGRLIRSAAATALVAGGAAVASGPAGAVRLPQRLTLYSVAEAEQYVNNSDSLSLGEKDNPFGNFSDVAPAASKTAKPPFPGDESIFTFNLYTSPSLSKRAGAATFICQYNFTKNAFCDASFQLKAGGTLIADGSFNFEATSFLLAITGGTGADADRIGSMLETPAGHGAERLAFQLARA
jgi:hypothetical protein